MAEELKNAVDANATATDAGNLANGDVVDNPGNNDVNTRMLTVVSTGRFASGGVVVNPGNADLKTEMVTIIYNQYNGY